MIPGQLMASAVTYAVQGWRVFPLSPGSKEPLPKSRGFLEASNDVNTVAQMWASHPTANVGIATGRGSGIWILDVDTKDGKLGMGSLSELARRLGDRILETRAVRTYSGGIHLYYQYPTEFPIGRRINAFKRLNMPDIDLIGDNGYAVAPPSVIIEPNDARFYEIIDSMDIAPTPFELIDAIRSADMVKTPRYERIDRTGQVVAVNPHSIDGMLLWLADRKPGEQDDALAWVMRALRDEGKTAAEAEVLCWPIVAEWPTSGKPWTLGDIMRHVRSAYR